MLKNLRLLFALAAILALVAAVACTKEVVKEVEVEVVVEKEVIKEVEVEVVVEKEVVKIVEVPGETVIVEKEVIKEIPVEVIVEKEVIKTVTIDKPVIVEKEVIRTVEVIKEVEGMAKPRKDFVNLAASSAVQKISPFTAVSGYTSLIYRYTHSALIQPYETGGKYVPDLAERWDAAEDGSSYTFYIRPNAVWHDGAPLTAADVEWSFTIRLDPKSKSRALSPLSVIKGGKDFSDGKTSKVAGITVIDDYTIKFDLEFPSSQFIGQMTGLIMPKHVLGKLPVDKVDDDPYWLGLKEGALMGSGPYMIADRKPDQFDELHANPDYYFGKPLIDRTFVFLIKSSDARAIAMQRNEVHALRRGGVSMDSIEVLLADPRFQIAATQGGQTGFSFNSRTPWLKDPRIRQAWMLAFDRKKICDVFNRGLCVFHNTNLNQPPGVYTQEMVDRYPIKGDPAKAKTLLAEAGWDSSREVSCKSPTADAARRAQFAAEQAMLADVGIKVKFEEMETPIWAAVYYENYNYDCVRVGGWGNRPTSMHYYFHSAATDAMGYSTPELDAMIDEAPRVLTTEDLVMLGQRMNKLFIEDLPIIPLYSGARMTAWSADLFIPGWGRRPQPKSLGEVPVTPSSLGGQYTYHLEQWEWEN